MSRDNCNPFAGGEVPPCSEFLGNSNPIIKDGELIFTNNNRIFFFISTNSAINNTNNNCSYSLANLSVLNFTLDIILYVLKCEYNGKYK